MPAWLALTAHTLVCASLPVRNTLMFLGKDSAMTTAVLVLTAQTINLLHTRGAWLRRPRNAVRFWPDTGRGHASAPQCHSMDAASVGMRAFVLPWTLDRVLRWRPAPLRWRWCW